MDFARPHFVILFALVPAAILFYVWAFRTRRALWARFVGESLSPRLVKGFSLGRERVRAALLVMAIAFFVLALLQPRWGFHWEEVIGRGVDIYLGVDISKSMMAQDVSPNRIERAKRKVLDFLSVAQGDRIGIIAFAGSAAIECPLTLDYNAVPTFLEGLDPDAISSPGTDIPGAVAQAGEGNSDKTGKTRALVLLSDGENHEGTIDDAIKIAKEKGVRVYAIGIGKDSGAPIPEAEGGGFKKDRSGEVVLTKLEEAGLKRLALATGGSYVRSVPGDEDIKDIYGDIRRQVEEREAAGGRRKKHEERFQWPLLLALLLMLWEAAWPDSLPKRDKVAASKAGLWRRLFGRRAVIALFLFGLVVGPQAKAASLGEEIRQGEESYKKGDYEGALEHFLSSQIEAPDNAKVRFNLADTYYKLGRFDEAEKLFRGAGQTDPRLSQKSHYNLGNTAFRRGKLDEAVREYEEALRRDPKDEDAKYNLEFVQKEMKRREESKKNEGNPPPQSKESPDQKPSEGKQDPQKDQKDQKDQKGQNSPEPQKAVSGKGDQEKNNPKSDPKSDEKKGNQNDKDKENRSGQNGKSETQDKGAVGKEGKPEMSQEEAEQWMSRLREEKKRPSGKKTEKGSRGNVDKDW